MMPSIDSPSTVHSRLVCNRSRDARCRTALRKLSAYMAFINEDLRALAPYAAMVALPGGSLMALLLWLSHQHRQWLRGSKLSQLNR
jgi:hypothetical protein